MAENKPTRARIFLYLTLLILVSFILLALNTRGKRQPQSVEILIATLVSPVQELMTNTERTIVTAWGKYVDLVDVKEENLRLKTEISVIERLRNQLTEIKLKQKRLLALLEIKEKSPHTMMMAKIIGYDSTNWDRAVMIDKGSTDGVTRKMPVVSSSGVVGKIESVYPFSSKVLLVTDIRNAVDAIIQETRSRGVMVGGNRDICEMKYVSLEEKVSAGFHIISSGFGGIYPKGLLLGQVKRVGKEFGLFQRVYVTPSSDMAHLEEVMVILH